MRDQDGLPPRSGERNGGKGGDGEPAAGEPPRGPVSATVSQAEILLQQMAGGRAHRSEVAAPSRRSSIPSLGMSHLEARYKTLIEQIPAITFMAALDGSVSELYVSPHIETMLGFTQDEWLGDPFLWYRQLHPDDRMRWQEEFARTCSAGVHFKSEYRFLSRDGEEVWVHGEATVVRDDQGNPLFLHGIAYDITANKEAERVLLQARAELEREVQERTTQLRESQLKLLAANERMKAILESAVDAIITIDEQGTIESANPATEQLFGYSVEELLGRNVRTLMPEPYRGEHDGYLQRYLETGEKRIIGIGREALGQRKDGSTFPLDLAVSEVSTEHQRLFTGIIRDITERKQFENQLAESKRVAEAASRSKSEFLANMSHEIRTPMNGIIGMTDLALETRLTPKQREFLETVKDSADSLLTIINDILDFSKIEAGKLDLESTEFTLRDSLGNTLKTLAHRAYQKGLELAWEVEDDVPDELFGDPTRLRQIVVNLVSNAVKFTQRGEVIVRVQREWLRDQEVCLRVSVQDTGIGIAPDKQQAIFDAFAQADTSTTRRFGGTGLGHSICLRLVHMMGGRLWVDSALGEGSAFHFTAVMQATEGPPTMPAALNSLSDLRVLVVDDHATNREIVSRMVKRWGMRPYSVSDGPSALRALRQAEHDQQPFALVITDFHMPGLDGFQLCQRIRQRADRRALPIIMLTSGAQDGSAEECEKLQIDSHLHKPAKPSEILDAIQRSLGGRVRDDALPHRESPAAESELDSLRVLLAEDNVVNQRLAVHLLKKRGHQVTVATTGREAIEAFRREPFDVILMDVQMPEMDGLEATAGIRSDEQQTGSHIPIIAMTAHAMTGDRERCLEAGMDGYVSKPVKPQQLFETVEDIVAALRDEPPVAAAGHQDSADTGNESVLNLDATLAAVGGDEQILIELVKLLIEDMPRVIGEIEQDFARSNARALAQSAHSLIGSLSPLGQTPLLDLATNLEQLARKRQLIRAAELFDQLRPRLEQLTVELKSSPFGPR